MLLTHKPLLLLPYVLLVTAKCSYTSSCLAAHAGKFELFCPLKLTLLFRFSLCHFWTVATGSECVLIKETISAQFTMDLYLKQGEFSEIYSSCVRTATLMKGNELLFRGMKRGKVALPSNSLWLKENIFTGLLG